MSAEATALSVDGDMMWVEARVDTNRAATVMLVRAVGPDGEPLEPIAMEPQRTEWVTRMFLPRRSDIRLTFEHIDTEGFSFVSRPAALIELGVDPAIFSLGETNPIFADDAADELPGPDRTRWAWLALALGAASLGLVALAVAWGRPRDAGDQPQPALEQEGEIKEAAPSADTEG